MFERNGRSKSYWEIIYGTDAGRRLPEAELRESTEFNRGVVHIHTTDSDGLMTPEEVVVFARDHNIDALIITDHDKVNGAKRARTIAEQRGYPIEVVVGTEGTAKINGVDRHVGAMQIEAQLPCYMSPEEFNKAAHEQGGHTFVPHLSLDWASLRPEEVLQANRNSDVAGHFEVVEIFNAAALKAFQVGQHPLIARQTNPVSRWVRGKLPRIDTNQVARDFFEAHNELFVAASGGADAHYKTALLDAITLYDPSMGIVDAMLHGRFQIAQRVPQSILTARDLAEGMIRSHRLERARQRGDGIILFEGYINKTR